MPETPRTWTLRSDGGFEGPRIGPKREGRLVATVEVVEKAPVDAERERLLDLLERSLKFGTDHDSASYRAQGETIEQIETALREYGRLGKDES